MKKPSLPVVAVLMLLTVAARAGGGVSGGSIGESARPTGSVRSAWAGALGDFFTQNQPAAGFGSTSLDYLARLEPDLTPRIAGFDADERILLQRLAVELQAVGADPETFARPEGAAEKAALLSAAAARAEAAADKEAEELLSRAPESGLTYSKAEKLSSDANRLWLDRIYLRPELRARLNGLRQEIARLKKEHQERVEAFEKELPGKISAGAFVFDDIVAKDADGWVLRDHSPDAFPTLEAAVDMRLRELQFTAPGPWSLGPVYQLGGVLRKYWIQRALDGEGGAAKQNELIRKVEAAERDLEAKVQAPPSPELARDLAEFKAYEATGRLPSARAIRNMMKLYDSFLYTVPSFNMKWRIADWLARGKPKEGYPSWEKLRESKRLLSQRLHRRTLQWMIGSITAMFGVLPFIGLLKAISLWFLAPVILAVVVPMAAFFYYLVRRDSLSDFSYDGEEAGRKIGEYLRATRPEPEGLPGPVWPRPSAK
ncbi:MAG TPA: hypothetical protein VNI01_13580 [Elusimicrobiota bacterium]|nr:hypothetical protein [Elusimicrobiota bacterium]